MNKAEINEYIKRRTQRDTALTNEWLKNRGITESALQESQLLLLQAQKTANELLHYHPSLIKHHKQEWLIDFAKRCQQVRSKHRITNKECYAVLNYAKVINRQVFKQHRQMNG